MSSTDTNTDLRGSFRCPVAESRQHCVLHVGGELHPGRLLDESAGGFAVLLDKQPNVEVAQTALLQTDSGYFQVRVMYMAEAPTPLGSRLPESDVPTQWFRLGLGRLGDALPEQEPMVSKFAKRFGLRKRDAADAKGWFPWPSFVLTCAAVVVPLCLIGLFWHSTHAKKTPAQWQNFWASWGGKKSAPRELPPALPTDPKAPFQPNAHSPRENAKPPAFLPEFKASLFGDRSYADALARYFDEQNSFAAAGVNLNTLVRSLPGPTVLILPEVVKRLHLTDAQQAGIHDLIDAMVEDIRELNRDPQAYNHRAEIANRRQEVHEAYLHRSLELLTSEQQTAWKKLIGETAPTHAQK